MTNIIAYVTTNVHEKPAVAHAICLALDPVAIEPATGYRTVSVVRSHRRLSENPSEDYANGAGESVAGEDIERVVKPEGILQSCGKVRRCCSHSADAAGGRSSAMRDTITQRLASVV